MEKIKGKTQLSALDFYTLPDHGGRNELIKGEIVPMSPAGAIHGKIAMRLGRYLGNFVEQHALGEVYADDELDGRDVAPGFKLALPRLFRD